MLTRIVHNSAKLCAFLDQMNVNLFKAQRQHLLNLADALLVCEDKKTLGALQPQFLEAPDASNLADFLRISPWQAEEARSVLRINHVNWIVAQAERLDLPKVLYRTCLPFKKMHYRWRSFSISDSWCHRCG